MDTGFYIVSNKFNRIIYKYKRKQKIADPVNKVYADISTIYWIASVSTTFTVFLMMQMIEAGYFRLDDPIEEFVSEIKEIKNYSDSAKSTFRQLARQPSGYRISE